MKRIRYRRRKVRRLRNYLKPKFIIPALGLGALVGGSAYAARKRYRQYGWPGDYQRSKTIR